MASSANATAPIQGMRYMVRMQGRKFICSRMKENGLSRGKTALSSIEPKITEGILGTATKEFYLDYNCNDSHHIQKLLITASIFLGGAILYENIFY